MVDVHEWDYLFKNFFSNIGREFNVPNNANKNKLLYFSKKNDGSYEAVPFEDKFKAIYDNAVKLNDRPKAEYHNEIKKLIDNGSVRYLVPGTSDVRILKTTTVKNEDVAKQTNRKIGDMALASEPAKAERSTLGLLWLKFKANFSTDSKIELASYQFFQNNPIKNTNIEEEKRALEAKKINEAKEKEAAAQKNKIIDEKSIEVGSEKLKAHSMLEAIGPQLETRHEKFHLLDERINNLFGIAPDKDGLPINSKSAMDTSTLPKYPQGIEKINGGNKAVSYLSLCAGIGSQYENNDAVSTYMVKELAVDKFLCGDADAESSKYFQKILVEGRTLFNNFGGRLNDKNSAPVNLIGSEVRKGIRVLNKIINSSHPADIINPDSNCFAAAKILKEVMGALNDNPHLLKAADLSEQDRLRANGACYACDIIDKSANLQKEIIANGDNRSYSYQPIAQEIALRGEFAITEFASHGIENLSALKKTGNGLSLNEKADIYASVYPKNHSNSVLLTLASNKSYFDDNSKTSELAKNIADKLKNNKKEFLINGIAQEAEQHSKKLLQNLQIKPGNSLSDSNEIAHINKEKSMNI